MNVIINGGVWSANIGNAFIQIGAEYIAKKIFGIDCNIFPIYDRPIYNNVFYTKKIVVKTSFEYIKNLEFDYFILTGPRSMPNFNQSWEETIKAITENGKKYLYLGAGLMQYDSESINNVKKLFDKYPPVCMTTRDRETYLIFKDVIENIYDGIDLAFFTSDAYKPAKLLNGPYIISNFDKVDEPYIFDADKKNVFKNKYIKIGVDDQRSILMNFPSLFTKSGLITDRRTDAIVYLLSMFPAKKRESKVYEYKIIRPDHRANPMIGRKAFRYEGAYCADIPEPYINLYANSSLTLSDRIHSCVITLAYGNPAMFFAESKRSALLKRVGAQEIFQKPTVISKEYLDNEKKLMLSFVDKCVKRDILLRK